jgi:hypothetical protein
MDTRPFWAGRNTLLVLYVRSIVHWNACEERLSESMLMMDYFLAQEITLADLYHLPYGMVIFEQLGLVNLETRPNVQR